MDEKALLLPIEQPLHLFASYCYLSIFRNHKIIGGWETIAGHSAHAKPVTSPRSSMAWKSETLLSCFHSKRGPGNLSQQLHVCRISLLIYSSRVTVHSGFGRTPMQATRQVGWLGTLPFPLPDRRLHRTPLVATLQLGWSQRYSLRPRMS